jgi:hypothetical protein
MSLRFGDGFANPFERLAEINLGQKSRKPLAEGLLGIDHGDRQIGLVLQLEQLLALHEHNPWPDF